MGSVTQRVVTFYSFKGGVGRSFALCDVAVYLARWGYRVLCVDFDLEAPGLERYFADWLVPGDPPGVLEILEGWSDDGPAVDLDDSTWCPISAPGVDDRLRLIRAGRPGDDYARRLRAIDWDRLFAQHGAGRRLEALRDRWSSAFDIVLVDSRTGWSDNGEICTIHLPDILVTLFTPNEQSLHGALMIADASIRGVSRLGLDRAPLRVVPVLTRVDKDEYDAQQSWTRRMLTESGRFVEAWDPQEETPREVLAELVVPYVPYWSYGERLAAMRDEVVSSLSVGRAHQTLAALLARGLSESTLLLKHRDTYVDGAAVGGSSETSLAPDSEHDVYISYPSTHKELALRLAHALDRRGVRVFIDQLALQPGDDWRAVLSEAQRRSRTFVVLVGPAMTATQTDEVNAILWRVARGQGRLVPVALVPIEEMPDRLQRFHAVSAPGDDPDALAEQLVPVALPALIAR